MEHKTRTHLMYLALTLAVTGLGVHFAGVRGLLLLPLCLGFWGIAAWNTARTDRELAQLSQTLNRILHGEEHLEVEAYTEGELGILRSEIHKMTVRLREQQQTLQEDKVYLANSLADLSHQLRTPLTSMNLVAELLTREDLTPQRKAKLCRELSQLLGQMDWLVTTLLKLSKLEAGTIPFRSETIPLEQLVEQAAAPFLIPMELREQAFRVECSGTFTGDVHWTAEAVGNLIKNAMEHTPAGGEITIRGRENALFSELVVEDTGPGIDPQDLPHLFERFYRGSSRTSHGFGIGLSLSQRIVTGQGGTIQARNRSPQGAQFILRFYKGTV
ncbi:HAMP domain-containing histidine kinase [Pseudoflavonifractor capillosus]|uniref:sensor histidine kinase n=1 Tax=Pseudoflavonifractor capillosus TaxID=106588 RepID=UPI001958BE92|nr:HAMP domain-containing sensor histidine kinase [Pseudoflavonifractor capillosus]MBM6896795.1 HAMP domain-containing histidine kinase [Pseudoflavonifractor capillosus]